MKDEALLNMIKNEHFNHYLFLHYLLESGEKPDISQALIDRFEKYDPETIQELLPYIW